MQSTLLGYECWFSNNILMKNFFCPSIACCYPALQRLQGASSILNHSTKCQKTCFPLRAQVTLSAQHDAYRRARHGGEKGRRRKNGRESSQRAGIGEGRQQGSAPGKHGHTTGLSHPPAAPRQLPATLTGKPA